MESENEKMVFFFKKKSNIKTKSGSFSYTLFYIYGGVRFFSPLLLEKVV